MERPVPEHVKRATAPLSTVAGDPDVVKVVSDVIADVRERGDGAVRQYSEKFDQWSPPDFRLSPEEIERIVASADTRVLDDIRTVQRNVRDFARHQRDSLTDFEVEAQPGVFLGQRSIPVGSVGAYVPGGRYPLVASAHMTVTTATVAGVEKIIACTPPIRGEIPVTTVAAMHLAGATDILLLGGVQAIAALAVGTATIPKVDLIAGPGNAYVAEAKRQLFGEIGIDLLAGPTEILIIADEHADPFVIAVDLLSQAEHGPDSPAVLITTSREVARRAQEHVEALLPGLPTRGFAGPAWRDHGEIIVVASMAEAYELADDFAFEHVEVLTEHPREALDAMRNYGALFLGEGTCVSYGDKVIGTNHTLPTRRTARHTGGLWVGKYLKTVTYQEVVDPAASAALGELCGRASRVEQFEGHARSGDVRSAKFGSANPVWIDDGLSTDRR
jgi:sulfopropanediol 3-dehydrogenase